jgi:hypothetical protein
MARIITYECEQCGSEIIVTETGETQLSPIYCCGITVSEVGSVQKKATPAKKSAKKAPKKVVAKKAPKKVAAKKVVKKVVAKKKATSKKKPA